MKNNEKYGVYQKKYSLRDIFNDKSLQDVLPMVNYRENGVTQIGRKISVVTAMKSFGQTVYDISKKSARPYYKPMVAHKNGNLIEISGTLKWTLNEPYNAIYNALQSQIPTLSYLVNNMDLIRTALKESEEHKRESGVSVDLYLRVNSKAQIQQMNARQRNALMNNIMENIFYGDGFEQTRAKFGIDKMQFQGDSYEVRKEKWRRRVNYVQE